MVLFAADEAPSGLDLVIPSGAGLAWVVVGLCILVGIVVLVVLIIKVAASRADDTPNEHERAK